MRAREVPWTTRTGCTTSPGYGAGIGQVTSTCSQVWPQRTEFWPDPTNPGQGAQAPTCEATAQRMLLPARPNCGVMCCRLLDRTRSAIVMIAAMLTLVVMTLLMVVALMFAAEIGWLMVDPTARGE